MDRRDKLGGIVVADRCSLLDLIVAAPIPVKLLLAVRFLACSCSWMRPTTNQLKRGIEKPRFRACKVACFSQDLYSRNYTAFPRVSSCCLSGYQRRDIALY